MASTTTSTSPPSAVVAATAGGVVLTVDSDEERRHDRFSFLLVLGVACGVILPLLGATGYFDPWETDYGEVARQMVVRDDYLYPFWKDAHFFSKPILLFWLTAPLYALLGADGPGPMPAGIEFVGRLPSALLGISTIAAVWLVARRMWSRRLATLSALVLATSPFWAFLSRQAITDMPYVATSSIALLLLIVVLFDDDRDRLQRLPIPAWLAVVIVAVVAPQVWEIARTGAFLNRVDLLGSERTTRLVLGVVGVAVVVVGGVLLRRRAKNPLLLASAMFAALSVLAKGPVGFAVLGLVAVVALLLVHGVSGLTSLLRMPGVVAATAVFLAVGAPWPLVMLAYDGLDESRKTWFQRFVLYDLLGRVGVGVHGDRGGLEYYVRYLGFGMVPWAGFVPVAAFEGLHTVRQRATDRAAAFNVVVVVWFFVVFLFFAATTTKFHHYALPAVVPAALLVGFLLDRLATAGARHWVVVGGFAAITTAIVLRELQTSPWEWLDLFTYHYKGYKPEYYFPVDTIDAISVPGIASTLPLFRVMPVVLGVLAIGAPVVLLLWWLWRGQPIDAADQSTFHSPHVVGTSAAAVASRKSAPASLLDVPAGLSRPLITGLVVGAVLLSVGAVQVVLARASAHWSQRWLLQTYFDLRQGDEKLIAYQMDWKGEAFYSKSHEIQIKKNAADLRLLVAEPGREFVLVQTDRFDGLKAALGKNGESRITVVDKSNAKWLLVTVD